MKFRELGGRPLGGRNLPGPYISATSRTALGGAGGSVVVPAAPGLTWNSLETDNEPDFLVDLPSGNVDPVQDAAAADHLIIEYQLQAGGAWTEYVDHTLTAGNITDDTITIAGVGSVTDGSYYFRGRIERGALIGTNSANEAVTIAAAAVPVNSVAPVISGNVQVGQTLTTTDGTWTNTPTGYTYQWKRDGVSIGGATANTRVLAELDAGAAITCEVLASNATGPALSAAASNSLTIDVYIVLTDTIADGADATTYNGAVWQGQTLGTAAANRKIVIGFMTRRTSGTPSISSGSVGAASGAEITANEQATIGGVWIWEYANTADATADISTTFADAGQLRLGARVYAVYGAGAGTGYNAFASAATTVANNSVVVAANGGAVSMYGDTELALSTITWTNATADGTESSIEGTGTTFDSAHRASGTVNISISKGGSAANLFLATVAYGPN
jgi:hypothetical protein